ncbi:MAG: asparagine synthetase B family protein, partial [Ginsengibacter sp.]
MCGFVGIINKTGRQVDDHLLRKMATTIHHRGPDEEGMMIEGPIGFFHKRLSIIDLSTGQQPMNFSNCTIVFNGEIYNYIELREDLKKKGHHFETTSDTEVILHLYIEYGNEFVNMLNGMFAFIIFDRNNNRIFITRDHFGIKPLYWFHDNNKIVFGSEIKALLAHPEIPTESDTENLYEYLT